MKRFRKKVNGFTITFSTIYQTYRIHYNNKVVGTTPDLHTAIEACRQAKKQSA